MVWHDIWYDGLLCNFKSYEIDNNLFKLIKLFLNIFQWLIFSLKIGYSWCATRFSSRPIIFSHLHWWPFSRSRPYDRRSISIIYSHHHFVLIYALSFNLLLLTIVRTRSQLENLSKDELSDKVLSLENFKNDIITKFSELNDRFNNFQEKYEMVNSNLSISKCCSELLFECITWLECNNLSNAQYNRRETLEINPVPSGIADDS